MQHPVLNINKEVLTCSICLTPAECADLCLCLTGSKKNDLVQCSWKMSFFLQMVDSSDKTLLWKLNYIFPYFYNLLLFSISLSLCALWCNFVNIILNRLEWTNEWWKKKEVGSNTRRWRQREEKGGAAKENKRSSEFCSRLSHWLLSAMCESMLLWTSQQQPSHPTHPLHPSALPFLLFISSLSLPLPEQSPGCKVIQAFMI